MQIENRRTLYGDGVSMRNIMCGRVTFICWLMKESFVNCCMSQVADALAPNFPGKATDPSVQFVTLQYALYITTFVCVIGGAFYLATAIFIEQDKNAAQRQIKGKT